MPIAIITGSSGLIGSESVEFFAEKGFSIVGIDNDMRKYFFGEASSTQNRAQHLSETIKSFDHHAIDIRNYAELEKVFQKYNTDIALIIHTAAQPSHDWAAREPLTDFGINATGTLNLLELTRQYCPDAVFEFTSTNKVYGDLPNQLPLIEQETRWELDSEHPFYNGIDETMSVDQCLHSLFGASKVSADILVQEYGRYFGMKTVCFRGGCLTGPRHAGAMLHGFLSYLMKCCVSGESYTIFGYKGKQVRDNIHSYDLVNAFYHFYQNPRSGVVYNMGGGRKNSCSVLEAVEICESVSNQKMKYTISNDSRRGDHQWYISSCDAFKKDYPNWQYRYSLKDTIAEIYDYNGEQWRS